LHLVLDLCKDKVMPNGDATPPAQAMGQQTPAVIFGNWREMRNQLKLARAAQHMLTC
jgi:hypothetical protein